MWLLNSLLNKTILGRLNESSIAHFLGGGELRLSHFEFLWLSRVVS